MTWSHKTKVLGCVRDPDARHFYLKQTIEHGWGLNVSASQSPAPWTITGRRAAAEQTGWRVRQPSRSSLPLL